MSAFDLAGHDGDVAVLADLEPRIERRRARLAPPPAAAAVLCGRRPNGDADEQARADDLHERPPRQAKVIADDFDDLLIVDEVETHDATSAARFTAV